MKKSLGPKPLVYPTPVFVIGTYDADGRPNAMTAAWGGVCCSDPVAVAVSIRSATYTHAQIRAREAFTINIASEDHLAEADYFGMVSGRDADKFAATGLTPVRSELVDAPYIGEFPVVIECKLMKTVEVGLHTQFIGKVVDVKADEDMLGEHGIPDIKKIRPCVFAPVSRKYYGIGELKGEAFSLGKPIKDRTGGADGPAPVSFKRS